MDEIIYRFTCGVSIFHDSFFLCFVFYFFLIKVNGDSLAEKAGLRVGDALLRINDMEIYQLRHKDAQDSVSRAGNNFELVVSR